MKNKKILITGGPTNERIDEVMKITNMSTGSISIELSHMFSNLDFDITLVGTHSIARSFLFNKYDLHSKINFIGIESTEDMLAAIKAESGQEYTAIIHAAAVADYRAEFSFLMEDLAKEIAENSDCQDSDINKRIAAITKVLTNPNCKINDDSKISSYEENLTVKLGLTTKIISHLKIWFPNAKLIGFKLLNNVSKEHLIKIAHELCLKNNMDYIMANDLTNINQGKYLLYPIPAKGYSGVEIDSPSSLCDFINELIS